ncbi:prp3 [Candida margitis]|uniref:prp3 n=1 Tax=Candida margitis TaxID=1775924 RepID=UPI00222802C6|nr:prp3 [Candida margitis]KAI5954017.1 prp3 [Candida margitis]
MKYEEIYLCWQSSKDQGYVTQRRRTRIVMAYGKRSRDEDKSDTEAHFGKRARGTLHPSHHNDDINNTQRGGASKSGKGLDVDIHPLLRSLDTTGPGTQTKGQGIKIKKWFDPTAYNPYINDSNSISTHRPKPLKFNKQGKYIEQGSKLREKLKAEEEERRKHQELESKGLVPDFSLNEESYQASYPPLIEWWDRPYLRDNSYAKIDDESRRILDNDDMPITSYIQHPVLIQPIWLETAQTDIKPMLLTKKERKRLRKNDRQIRHKEMQDRIKLGLEPPPEPKVKLSNLMNVLTNEAIRDPTAVENRVKQQVEERLHKHLAGNEARKLTKEEKHAKMYSKQEQDLAKGIFTTVYRISNLENPQHSFKVDINAKQDNLYGICLRNPNFNLVIVEGGEKSINHYKKLLMNRIKWNETTTEGASGEKLEETGAGAGAGANEDATTEATANDHIQENKCIIIWEGRLSKLNFQKWSFMYSQNDEEAINVLKKFGLENYWRLAKSK